MNVSFLLKQYFHGVEDTTIDVFDAHTLNDVYQQVLATLTNHFEIEVSVLQALSYCLYGDYHIQGDKSESYPLEEALCLLRSRDHQ